MSDLVDLFEYSNFHLYKMKQYNKCGVINCIKS